jgi:hypothetical protein
VIYSDAILKSEKDEQMSEWNKQKLLELMAEIAPGKATAEQESDREELFLKNFLPIADYRRALEPNILLIQGGRGVGKTELFRLLAIPSGRESLVKSLDIRSLPELSKTIWIAGYGRTRKTEKRFPAPETVESQLRNASNLEWRGFWLGLVLGVILQEKESFVRSFLLQELAPSLITILEQKLSLLSEWKNLVHENLEKINFILDKLDEELIREDAWLFITYDELDRLVPTYTDLAAPIRELLALWLDRSRRWERICPKVFLRTDLFSKEFLGFSDASKLQHHRLEWQHPWLYQLLIKRLANSGVEMREYLRVIPDLVCESSTDLGWTISTDEKLFESLIEKMIGKYMGANAKKGITYRWIPNHLQDAGGRIAPRSFLKLFSLAAEEKLDQLIEHNLSELQLLQPSDLQGALMNTSEDRIKELAQEEYPWLESLKTSLNGLRVPLPKDQFLEALKATRWSPTQQPPASDPENIFQYLLQLGVVESRSDQRINIPEIYLYGFKMKRSGGVKRPK